MNEHVLIIASFKGDGWPNASSAFEEIIEKCKPNILEVGQGCWIFDAQKCHAHIHAAEQCLARSKVQFISFPFDCTTANAGWTRDELGSMAVIQKARSLRM
jgi:hypothetical protein